MSAPADFLRVARALRLGLVSEEQVQAAAASWAAGRGPTLIGLLLEAGALRESDLGRLNAPDGGPASLEAQEAEPGAGVEVALAAPAAPDAPVSPEGRGTVMEWKSGQIRGGGAPEGPGAGRAAADTADEGAEAPRPACSPPAEGMEGVDPRGRYAFGKELGRGGLGRVVEAVDRVFGRPVAVKTMLGAGRAAEAAERFLREGRIAGRLPHPNIVPVYELGLMQESGGSTPFFTMAMIRGRDLEKILESVEAGEADAAQRYSRYRLLQIFQEVCHAMAYAHDHGVIHRDLKPSNVMVGEYGEVYVVDWGLAKVAGGSDPSDRSDRPDPSDPSDRSARDPALTAAGAVLGTPAYMPPEQAEGRIEDVDEKSDIFSLGAILYQILTFRPPFEGPDAWAVVRKARSGALTPPSQRVSQMRGLSGFDLFGTRGGGEPRAAPGPGGSGGPTGGPGALARAPDPVPPALEEIVLRAMAREKGERYRSVQELGGEIQAFLEGEKERERKRTEAAAWVAKGRGHSDRFREMGREIEESVQKWKDLRGEVAPWMPVEDKRPLWAAADRVQKLREQRMVEFGNAEFAYDRAAALDPEDPRGAEGKGDLYLDRFLEAERRGDREEMAQYVSLLARFDRDGRRMAEISKPGTLSLRTLRFDCGCMRPAGGRRREDGAPRREPGAEAAGSLRVEYREEPGWSWKDGGTWAGEIAAEDDRPIPSFEVFPADAVLGHSKSCEAREEPGADAWLFRFVEKDKALLPGFPSGIERLAGGAPAEGSAKPVPGAVLDRLYDPGSPYRPDPASGFHLGRTPLRDLPVPRGSYLVILAREGFRPLRLPVRIDRGGVWRQDAVLYREEDVPAGFVSCPGGEYLSSGEKAGGHTEEQTRRTRDFFMSRLPVTFAEYAEFLEAVSARDPEDARRRQPRQGNERFLQETPGPSVPSAGGAAVRWSVPAPGRDNPLGLTPAMPVMGISWHDAMAYAAWLSSKEGRLFTLPHEDEWEKCARGVDGRVFPWGYEFDGSFANTSHSHEGHPRIRECGSFPVDESPCGAMDMAGNMITWCLNLPIRDLSAGRLLRGGSWAYSSEYSRAGNVRTNEPTLVYRNYGFRLVFRARDLRPGR